MSHAPHLSLSHAILINLNAMVGSGLFINTVILAQLAGAYSPATYLLVGIAILPLMICFAHLAYHYPHGSLYTYSATLTPSAGLWSSWSYFHAKLASCAVALHVSATLIKTIIIALEYMPLAEVPLIAIDIALLLLFTLLNYYHLKTGKILQLFFMCGKLIPIATIIVIGIFFPAAQGTDQTELAHIIAGIPLVLYAFMGFETSSGFTRSLINAAQNSWRAMAAAFIGGITITTLFQYCAYRALPHLGSIKNYFMLFPGLLELHGITGATGALFLTLLHGGIALSAAGVAYSILYANSGNLHELAQRGLIRGSRLLAPMNQYHVAARCLIIECCIVLIYLVTATTQIALLQQIAASGVVMTYSISMLALWNLYRNHGFVRILPLCGMLSCLILIAAMARSGIILGWTPYLIYITVQCLGMALLHSNHRVRTVNAL